MLPNRAQKHQTFTEQKIYQTDLKILVSSFYYGINVIALVLNSHNAESVKHNYTYF